MKILLLIFILVIAGWVLMPFAMCLVIGIVIYESVKWLLRSLISATIGRKR